MPHRIPEQHARPLLGLIALCAVVALPRGAIAQAPASVEADRLTATLSRALAEQRLVGATWSLVTPEGTRLGAAGMKDVSRGALMSPNDRVQLGSVAKTFVAVGMLRLVTQGVVALDSPVAHYLPDLPIKNRWAAESPLLVRHLLDHTGGLDDARMWQVFTLRAEPDDALLDGLVRAGDSVQVRHPPGDRFSYSNTGFLIAAMVIEAVTGARYERWLDQELLVPLRMLRSTAGFVTQRGPWADTTLAMGHYDAITTAAAVPIPVRPASQFTTTADDMARFARFLMSDGTVDGRTLVDAKLLRSMAVPTTTEAAQAGLAAGYALGLVRRDRHGAVGACHFGNIGTFRAAFCIFPPSQRAFFIAHNTDPETVNWGRIDSLLVHALELPVVPESPPAAPSIAPMAWDGRYLVRPNRFEQFAYLDALTGVVRAKWDGSQVQLTPWMGTARGLTPVGGRLFRAPGRREASHVLTHSPTGIPVITDGNSTLERVAPRTVLLRQSGALVGITSMLYLLLVGGVRSVKATLSRRFRAEPLRWSALALALLLIAPALFLTQPFLSLGDPTPASWAVAITTGLLPPALIASLWATFAAPRAAKSSARARLLDAAMLLGALQWCLVLASWALLPLVLWR